MFIFSNHLKHVFCPLRQMRRAAAPMRIFCDGGRRNRGKLQINLRGENSQQKFPTGYQSQ